MAEKKKTRFQLGRPPKWEKPEDLLADVERYIEHCEETGKFMHKTGFAAFMNCSKQTIYRYLDEKSKEFSDAINIMMTLGEEDSVQTMWKTEKPSYAKSLIMKNIHGYRDNLDVADSRSPRDVAKALKDLDDEISNSVGGDDESDEN